MTTLDDQDLAALALTSRLVDSAAKPLSDGEFWALRHVVEPSTLLGMSVDEVATACAVAHDDADRIARLLDRAVGLAMAVEKLDHAGIWTLTSASNDYPKQLHNRLRDTAPVVLHGVGDSDLLDAAALGILGSRDGSAESSQAALDIACRAVMLGHAVISGTSSEIERDAMNAALDTEGQVIAIPDTLERIISRPKVRQGVAYGRICLLTPNPPTGPTSSPSSASCAKIVYVLARCTIVVACKEGKGGTWEGATDALKYEYGPVASWVGVGSGPGNRALVREGADEVDEVSGVDDLLVGSRVVSAVDGNDSGDQLLLDIDVERERGHPETI